LVMPGEQGGRHLLFRSDPSRAYRADSNTKDLISVSDISFK